MEPADVADLTSVAASGPSTEIIERLPLPPPPPPIRALRFREGPPPPSAGSAPNAAWRSPQASANPVQLLGPSAVVRSAPRRTRVVVGVVVVALLAGIVATAAIFVRAFEGTTLVNNLSTGDCLSEFFEQDSRGEYIEVFLVKTTPCSEAHALEVYAVTDQLWASPVYPGIDEAFATGEDWCFTQYDSFIGGDYATSLYEVWTFVPQETSWNAGDRTVQCLVGHYDEVTLTWGSLEGVDR